MDGISHHVGQTVGMKRVMRALTKEGWRPFSAEQGLPGAPPAVTAIATRCCAHDPDARPSFPAILECLAHDCAEEVKNGWAAGTSEVLPEPPEQEQTDTSEPAEPPTRSLLSEPAPPRASVTSVSTSPLTSLGPTATAGDITKHVNSAGATYFHNERTGKTGWERKDVEEQSELVPESTTGTSDRVLDRTSHIRRNSDHFRSSAVYDMVTQQKTKGEAKPFSLANAATAL
jgi:hypothetical protein